MLKKRGISILKNFEFVFFFNILIINFLYISTPNNYIIKKVVSFFGIPTKVSLDFQSPQYQQCHQALFTNSDKKPQHQRSFSICHEYLLNFHQNFIGLNNNNFIFEILYKNGLITGEEKFQKNLKKLSPNKLKKIFRDNPKQTNGYIAKNIMGKWLYENN